MATYPPVFSRLPCVIVLQVCSCPDCPSPSLSAHRPPTTQVPNLLADDGGARRTVKAAKLIRRLPAAADPDPGGVSTSVRRGADLVTLPSSGETELRVPRGR